MSTAQKLVDLSSQYRSNLKICHVNAESLACDSHALEFCNLFENSNVDIVAVSETFAMSDSDVPQLTNFNSVCAHRTSHGGGGVVIYISTKYKFTVLSKSVSPPVRIQKPDFVIVEIVVNDTKILLGCVYRPPKAGFFGEFADAFGAHFFNYNYHIVLGDVNAHFHSTKPCDIRDAKAVNDFISLNNLSHVPFLPTFHRNGCDSYLDMIVSSSPDRLVHADQFPAIGLSAHDLIVAVFSFSVPKFSPIDVTFRDFRNLDVDALRSDALNVPWHEMFHYTDVNAKVEFFNSKIYDLFDRHAPYKNVRIKHRPKPWFTNNVRTAIVERDIAYQLAKNSNDPLLMDQYRKLRNKAKSVTRSAKSRHSYNLLGNSKSSKELWNNLKKLEVTPPRIASACNAPCSDELNRHYTNVSCPDADLVAAAVADYNNRPVPDVDPLFFKHVFFEDLYKALYSISPNSKGVDDISVSMLKLCIVELAPAILHIFNYSLQTGRFPNLWKIANVKPLPKKPGAASAKDFRPISLLCSLGKALEKVVYSQLIEHLTANSMLNPLQSGFRAGHSTSTALLKVAGDLLEAMDNRLLSILVLYDFSNAFPSVHHELLLAKLKQFGLSSSVISWISSYLDDRFQRVVNGSDISSLIRLCFGVPQGSVLGPLLFSLYVNDVSHIFRTSKHHLYADDLQNYLSCKPDELAVTVATLNEDAVNLVLYAKRHNLSVNASKTQAIIVGNYKYLRKLPMLVPPIVVDDVPITYTKNVNDLGVLLDESLNWEDHTLRTCKRARSALSGIRRHRNHLPQNIRKRLVEALVFPTLDYCNALFSTRTAQSTLLLQRVQNACARFIFDLPWDGHTSSSISALNWLNITARFKYALLLLFKKVLVAKSPLYLSSRVIYADAIRQRAVRSHPLRLRVPVHHTDKGRGAFWVCAPQLWNDLPTDILDSVSIPSFKRKLRIFLQS